MKYCAREVLIVLCMVLLIPSGVTALAVYSGGQVVIAQPVPDDVFVSGGAIEVNAPVDSLIAAGGTVTVNAPVKGDVIATGGTVAINGDVGGKLVAAGGTMNVNGAIGTNAVLAGGNVELGQNSTVARDAMIAASRVSHQGSITGNLTVRAQTFENAGNAGYLTVDLSRPREEFSRIFSILGILFTAGMFILGLLLLHFAPGHFMAVEEEVRRSPILKVVGGFVAIVVSFIILVLISLSIVLLPVAILLWMAFFAGLLLSTLFVSLALGRMLALKVPWEAPPWQMFLVGFIIINVVSRIPIAGIVVLVVAGSLGFAAFFTTLSHNRDRILGKGPSR